ncbi:amino acid adenylation domain-containing protein, partial [Nonomuraea sp. NPDC002799]
HILLTAFTTVLSRWTGQNDLIIGTPHAGRPHPQLEKLIGFFINTLPLRHHHDPHTTFTHALTTTKNTVLQAQTHADTPFETLVDALAPERELSHSPLVQTVFGLHHLEHDQWPLGPDLHATWEPIDTGTAKFDLTFSVLTAGHRMWLDVEYATDLYDPGTISRFIEHWLTFLDHALTNPAAPLTSVSSLPADEHRQLRHWSNDQPARTPNSRTLDDLVAERAEQTPDAIAITADGAGVTYRELLQRADAIAEHLVHRGVRPGDLVGLCCDRSAELVIGMLGILRAGGAYVPLDPDYPDDRLAFMLADSDVRIVLGRRQLLDALPLAEGQHPVPLGDLPDHPTPGFAPPAGRPHDPAYVIYTSGSTGRPKGVLVSHDNVVGLFDATRQWFGFSPADVWTLFHSAAFDFSVWEIWGALTTGGRLVVVPFWESRDAGTFYELVAREGVTVLNQTPAAFRSFAAADESRPRPLALRTVIFGGEALDVETVSRWWERHAEDSPRLVNMYGITETTVHVTYCPLTRATLQGSRSPIGRPIPDLTVHVLDAYGELAPLGVPGEMYVGGRGVALGYLNRATTSAERFVPDPFSAVPGSRLYRTGDLARRLPDGTLEFLGRNDDQVKIRGFRIELGEIGAVLTAHPRVRGCVVTTHGEPGDARLIAYVVPSDDRLTVEELLEHLSARLPAYMIPAATLFLDELPLTGNGKVDRDRLPEPGAERPELRDHYVAPRTETERILAEVWAEVLDLDRVGVDDNFFYLGGDSIRSLQVLALAREKGLDFTLQQLFQLRTIAALARETQGTTAERSASEAFSLVSAADRDRMPADVVDAYPLAALQAGMIFHMEEDRSRLLYLNFDSFHVRAPFVETAFRTAVQQVVARHPVLRTSFHLSGYSELLQLVHREATLPIVVEDISGLSELDQQRVLDELMTSERAENFDLTKAPLLRFFIHLRSDETFQWSLVEHHAILDGWSLNSTIAEILERYLALLKDPGAVPPPAPVVSFRDFIKDELETIGDAAEKAYWVGKLRDANRLVIPRWPSDTEVEPAVEAPAGAHFYGSRETTLPRPLRLRLEEVSGRLGVPLKSVLLAAHVRVLEYVSGRRDVITGVTQNGRPAVTGGTDARGLFLNSLPFRVSAAGGSWADLARQVFAEEQELLPHRRYPSAELQRIAGNEQLYETYFVYNHFHVLGQVLGAGEISLVSQTNHISPSMRVEPTNFTLVCGFLRDPLSGELLQVLDYHTDKLREEQVSRIWDYYHAALRALAYETDRPVADTPLMPEGERALIERWNNTARPAPLDRTVADLIAEQAEQRPTAVAVVSGEVRLTYAELMSRAEALAVELRGLGVGRGDAVGLCCDRSADLVVGMLGILCTGGAYVPFDPDYPADRLAFMLDDSDVRIVVGHRPLLAALPMSGRLAVPIEEVPETTERVGRPVAGGDDLACLLYTSGSTGRPKGVMVPHRGIIRLGCETDYVRLTPRTVSGQMASASFDPHLFELWAPLLNGGQVVIVPTEVSLAPARFAELVRAEGITTMVVVTALFNGTIAEQPDAFATVEQLYTGGEALNPGNAAIALGAGRTEVYNAYGPTEVSTISTWAPVTATATSGRIGRPIANTQAWILDQDGRQAPIGAPGELCLGGPGVALGYWRRPGLTAERFIPDPAAPGRQLYRTGDLARLLPDGTLEFLGRMDHQVKIRGHRIEPGEIESVLAAHPDVAACVVTPYRPAEGPVQLVAYLQPREDAIDPARVRAHAFSHLPEYMVPATLIVLDRLPLNPNGKIDRHRLPAPDTTDAPAPHVPPRNPLERLIADIWADVLHRPEIGVHDNFFTLGGHSLAAVKVTFSLQSELGIVLGVRDVLRTATVHLLAEYVAEQVEIQLADLGDALGDLESLSEEEVQHLLHNS